MKEIKQIYKKYSYFFRKQLSQKEKGILNDIDTFIASINAAFFEIGRELSDLNQIKKKMGLF